MLDSIISEDIDDEFIDLEENEMNKTNLVKNMSPNQNFNKQIL